MTVVGPTADQPEDPLGPDCMCDFDEECSGTGMIMCVGCGGDQCVCRACYGQGGIECDGCDQCRGAEKPDDQQEANR